MAYRVLKDRISPKGYHQASKDKIGLEVERRSRWIKWFSVIIIFQSQVLSVKIQVKLDGNSTALMDRFMNLRRKEEDPQAARCQVSLTLTSDDLGSWRSFRYFWSSAVPDEHASV